MHTVEPKSASTKTEEPFGYAFDGVRLELGRGRLLVDGVDSGAGPLILKLLAVLCRAPGLLVLRQQLFDALWPRQTVSDEALTKLIARLRETLGPYGRRVVTLRGRGVRLDASVTELDVPVDPVPGITPDRMTTIFGEAANEGTTEPIQRPASETAAHSDLPTAPPMRSAKRVILAAAALLVIVAFMWPTWREWASPAPEEIVVVPGFGITEADLSAAQPATRDMLREATAALDRGEIEHAMTLVRVAHESDLGTPVPGALLAYYQSRRQLPADPKLQTEIAARLGDAPTPYVRLLVRLASDVTARADQGAPTMAAMVAMRPSAWRLQLRIAHESLSLRRNGAALAALRKLPQEGIPADLIVAALSDRASLGDAKAVQRAVDDGVLTSAPPEYRAMLLGRLAWTDGRTADAIRLMDEAVAHSVVSNNFRVEIGARVVTATFAMYVGQADADARFRQTESIIRRTTTLQAYLPEIAALRAQIALDRGDRAAATDLLRGVTELPLSTEQRLALETYNTRLGLVLPPGSFLGDLDRDSLNGLGHAAALHLIDAWLARIQGRDAQAREQLAAARSASIDETYLREDADALAAAFGNEPVTCRPDPPFPNLLRFSACRTAIATESIVSDPAATR